MPIKKYVLGLMMTLSLIGFVALPGCESEPENTIEINAPGVDVKVTDPADGEGEAEVEIDTNTEE
ncbi:hypothetical protein Pla110_10610 [Polystyrenella longa]|uniref:Uncharacterized protein n=1 Tax=Polystyrenella longa TaxID=2528007 RepID=A0A518CJF3_9PLAN|nr:hypothetical protein [Polystyrenella longa]QDU79353.1 hypothetical protein Pla110_10610 [Polystyrenella longa]